MIINNFRNTFLLFIILFTVFMTGTVNGQVNRADNYTLFEAPDIESVCVLEPLEYDDDYRYNPYPNVLKSNATEGGASFDITYLNDCGGREWPEEAKVAFDYAAQLWGSHLNSSVPISIEATWKSLGENTLGSAGPTAIVILSEPGTVPNTYYAIAQANAMLGTDLKENSPYSHDIRVNISCDRTNWYYGTDAMTPGGQFDLVTVLLHEIGHGIGFLGTMSADNNGRVAEWGVGDSKIPLIYDQFTLDHHFDHLIDTDSHRNPSTSLYEALTGLDEGVYFSADESEFALDRLRVPLYTPSPYQKGSSYSHLDQIFFSTNGPYAENALMRPAIPFQFAIHSPGPVFCGLLNDMGWPLGPACEQLIEDDAPLERPVLALPGNGIKKSGTTPQLVWNDVNGATSYQVQISKNYTHTDIVFDETSPGTSLTVNSGLSPATIYFWRVRAIGSGSTSSWSSNYRFTTALDIPNTVTLFSPENGAINQPTAVNLFWESINGVDNYTLQVATNPNFNSQNLVIERTLKINEFSTSQLIDFSTTYYWRVKARSNIGETDWSETWSFTTIIERPLAVTAFITPINDEVQVPVTTKFNWEPSERASDYTIQISTDEDFSTVPISGFVSNSQFTNDDPLDFAEVYYWRVRASNIGGESNWSETNRFITEVQETKISDNYPNPFSIFTTLRYQLSDQRYVLVDVFDMTGRRVSVLVDGEQGPGVYFESLHANHFASGIYMIRFVAGDVMDVQKMTIIK